MSVIAEIATGVTIFLTAGIAIWKIKDLIDIKEVNDALKSLIKANNIKHLEEAHIKIINVLLDDSMAGNKNFKKYAIYINASLFKSLTLVSEKIVKSSSNEKKSNTVVGMMISDKMKKSSKAQGILIISIIIHMIFFADTDSLASGLALIFIVFLLLCIQVDHKIIEYRISKGLYGKNEFEAREIIEFIFAHANKDDFNDSGKLKRVIPQPKLEDVKDQGVNLGGATA